MQNQVRTGQFRVKAGADQTMSVGENNHPFYVREGVHAADNLIPFKGK